MQALSPPPLLTRHVGAVLRVLAALVPSLGARVSEKGAGWGRLVSLTVVKGRAGTSSTPPPEDVRLPLPTAHRTTPVVFTGGLSHPPGRKRKGREPTQPPGFLWGGIRVSPFPSTHCSLSPSPGHHPCSWGHCPSLPSHVPQHPPIVHMAASVIFLNSRPGHAPLCPAPSLAPHCPQYEDRPLSKAFKTPPKARIPSVT